MARSGRHGTTGLLLLAEMKSLLRLAAPMTLSQTLYGVVFPVTLAFCGSLGTVAIDKASLAVSLYQLFIVSFEDGLRWTAMAMMGQVLRTEKPCRVGIYVQRGIFVAILCWLFALAVSINAANLLILIGQDPEIAIGAEQFLMILTPGCLAVLISRILLAYMDSQKVVLPSTVIQTVFCGICFPTQYALINYTSLGIAGAAIGLSASQCLLPIMLGIYIRLSGFHRTTWAGWNQRSLQKWGQFFRNLLPTSLALLVAFMATELGTFLAGIMGKEELAAQSIAFQVYILAIQLPFGLVMAGSVTLTQYVSRREVRLQRIAIAAQFIELSIMGIIFGVIILLFRHSIPRVFTADEDVIDIYASVVYFLAPYTATQIATWVFPTAFRSYNRNGLALGVSLVSYFLIGHPLGLGLIYGVRMGMHGLWTGLLLAAMAYSTISTLVYLCIDWARQTTAVMSDMGGETEAENGVAMPITTGERVPLLAAEEPIRPTGDESLRNERQFVGGKRDAKAVVLRCFAVFAAMTALVACSVGVRIAFPPSLGTVEVTVSSTSLCNVTVYTK